MSRLPALIIAVFVAHETNAADDVLFERHVRPILKAHCFHCHGEAGEKEGGLDLRLRRLIVAGGDSGAAIVPEDATASLLMQRVRSGEMPPGDDKRLSDKDIRVLEAWVVAGAKTARLEPDDFGDGPLFTEEERNYWAFQSVARPVVPDVEDTGRIRSPIDAFIIARQLSRSNAGVMLPDATREQLIRRAYFDLIGLPPPPEAIDAFVADNAGDDWEELIDELLQSPHYGERWGRHWLDVAGYADSEGYTDEDRVRPHAWRYRDYVIRSFNADKPFDVFVQEQLAGDEMVPLPHTNLSAESIDKLTATGFLRMAPDGTASGGIDQAEARNQVIADTLQIVGSSLLGLTVNCAQCHDHRYDPIPTTDYYRLRAIFEPAFDWNNWKTPPARQISLYTDADRKLAATIEAEAAEVDRQRKLKVEEYITRTLQEELSLVPAEKREALQTAYRTAGKDRDGVQKALLKEYPSVAAISEGSLYLYDRRRSERAAKIDAERKQKAKRFVAAAAAKALEQVPMEERALIAVALQVKPEARTAEQSALLLKYPATQVNEANLAEFLPDAAAELQQDIAAASELRASKAADDLKTYTEKAAEIRGRKPKEGFLRSLAETPGRTAATFVFYRGDHEQPKDEVSPGEPSILARTAAIPLNDESVPTTGRRLAFARSLTSGQHPLFARVIVNRIWLHHFGRGLVDTPGDFGVLGSKPTHPKLLDWLAAEFVDSEFSVKHLHRLIMRSSVYRQASVSASSRDGDRPNDYVGFPLRRLESEIIRDAVLSVAGLLNPKQFGEPVPVMEDAVGQIVLGIENLDGERKPTKPIPLNGEEFRRSVYVQVRRSRTLSLFETFDAPAVSPNCEKRSTSTATPQSLLMMNSDFALKYADAFAQRVMKEAGLATADQIKLAWRLAYGLAPLQNEIDEASAFLTELKTQVLPTDSTAKPTDQERKAFAVLCQALLSSNRFLYVE